MKSLITIFLVTLLSLVAAYGGTSINQDDLMELKTYYPDSTARTTYKGNWSGKIFNIELRDPNGSVVLKVESYNGTLQELSYFKDTTFSMTLAADSVEMEVDILLDSLKVLKTKIDKASPAAATILLWINGKGAVEHAVWFWYSGLSRRYMRKSMVFAENWKTKPIKSGKGYVVRKNIDFK